MLIIRNTQMAAVANASFEAWLLEHVRRFFPAICSELGGVGALAFVKATVARARQHGLGEGPDICCYIDLACTFGADFDRAQPWAESILAAANARASTMTMDRLHEAAMETLEAEAAQVLPRLEGSKAGPTFDAALDPLTAPETAGEAGT